MAHELPSREVQLLEADQEENQDPNNYILHRNTLVEVESANSMMWNEHIGKAIAK